MALHFILDGYNLLYALPDIPPGTLEQKREALLALLRKRRPQGNNPVTVVFDSREGSGDRRQEPGLTILFTAGETADDRIGKWVRETPTPRACVVVSNDRGVQALIRGTGAKWMSATDFLKKARKLGSTPPVSDLNLREDITDEFKKKWL